ncbi:hypothetical protein IF2G_03108 [Cordyceps javanica]|nr:hypothetical protein IF2G_03108 [Cordyceps javanica]
METMRADRHLARGCRTCPSIAKRRRQVREASEENMLDGRLSSCDVVIDLAIVVWHRLLLAAMGGLSVANDKALDEPKAVVMSRGKMRFKH